MNNHKLDSLKIKIFADGADKIGMINLYNNPTIKGLTTNPTLMRKAGISDYEQFAKDILKTVKNKPISFEVFSDDFDEMKRQAIKIARWQNNVYVKIPITNTRGESSAELIHDLSSQGVKLNVTAILTLEQVQIVSKALNPTTPSVISIFAGRIADTGVDPTIIVKQGLQMLTQLPNTELLWASVREVLNIFQANDCGCHIVTVPHDILKKAASMCNADLGQLSLDTVKMFSDDAANANYYL